MNLDAELADLLGGTVPSSDAFAGKKQRAQGIEIPIAPGTDSPSTAVNSKASPASIDISSATGSRTPAQVAGKSRAKAPEVVGAKAMRQGDQGSDADNFDTSAVAGINPTASTDLDMFAAGGGKRAAAVVSTNVPAGTKGKPKPPDSTSSAAAKRIPLQQSPLAAPFATPSPSTKASAEEGGERDAPSARAGDEDSKANLVAMMDSAVMHSETQQRKPAQADLNARLGESSMSEMSAGGGSTDGDASQALEGHAQRPYGSAKSSAKSGAKVAQRTIFSDMMMASTPEFPVAMVNSDEGVTSSFNFAGKPVALSHAIARIPEASRSDSEDSFEGRPAVAPPVPRPRAVGAGGATSSSDSTRRKNEVAQQAALAGKWNEVEVRANEFRDKDSVEKCKSKADEDVSSKIITFGEVMTWVNDLSVDVEVLKQIIEGDVKFTQCGCFSRRRSASSIPGLSRRCQREKDRVFLLKSTDFDVNDLMHFRMLRTVYTKLTRNTACARIGEHWEALGFQHADPGVDLNRSGRLLNVLHFFSFFTHHFDTLESVYLLAQSGEQHFPLACVCINLTHMVVQCLSEGKLSRLCNASDKSVLDTTCKIFAGSLFYFYMRWKILKRTIRDTEATMKEVRVLLEKSPVKLLHRIAAGVDALEQQASSSKFEFTALDFSGRAPGAGGARQVPDVPQRLRNYLAQR